MSRIGRLLHFNMQTAVNQNSRFAYLIDLLDTTLIRVSLVGAIVVLGVLYIWLVNSSASSNFALSDLRKQSVALEDGYQKMELKQTALRSLSHTQDATNELKLTTAGVSQYVGSDSAVALLSE